MYLAAARGGAAHLFPEDVADLGSDGFSRRDFDNVRNEVAVLKAKIASQTYKGENPITDDLMRLHSQLNRLTYSIHSAGIRDDQRSSNNNQIERPYAEPRLTCAGRGINWFYPFTVSSVCICIQSFNYKIRTGFRPSYRGWSSIRNFTFDMAMCPPDKSKISDDGVLKRGVRLLCSTPHLQTTL